MRGLRSASPGSSASACSRTPTSRSSGSRSRRRPARASPRPTAPCATSRPSSRGTTKCGTASPTSAAAIRASTTTSSPRRRRRTSARSSSSCDEFDPRRSAATARGPAADVRATTPARASSSRVIATARRSTRRSRSRWSGPTSTSCSALANQAETLMVATPGTRDVDNPARRLRTDLDLRVDTDKAALLGVAPVEIDRTVRAAVAGLDGRQVPRDRRRRVRHHACGCRCRGDRRCRRSITSRSLRRPASRCRCGSSTDPAFSTAPSAIRRHDRLREYVLTAYPTADSNVAQVTQAVLKNLETLELPPGYSIRAGGELEAQQESFGGIGTAVLVAVFGILAVLVLEFGSFRSMLIVAGRDPARHGRRLRRAVADRLRPVVHGDDRLRRADRHRDQELDPAGRLHQPAARAGRARSTTRSIAGRRDPLPADPAHLGHRDRRPAAARPAGHRASIRRWRS